MNNRRTITKEIAAASCGMETFSSIQGTLSAAEQHIVGVATTDNVEFTSNRMYVNFSLPTTAVNHRIQKVELVVFQQAATSEASGNPKLGLYRAEEVAVENAPESGFSPTLTDYVCIAESADAEGEMVSYAFDITRLIDEANNAVSTTHTLVMKLLDESLACNCNAVFYGASHSDYAPVLRITYAINYGVSVTGHAHKLGRFGQGCVDLATGNLMLEFEDFTWAGNRMPITLKHQYTGALKGCQYTANGAYGLLAANYSSMMVGLGWRLNVMQSMVGGTFTVDGTQHTGYVYTDENGDEVFFTQNESGVYEDISGSGMVYDTSTKKLTVGDSVYQFDGAGKLINITDQHGNRMLLTYSGSRLMRITDGADRTFNFYYSGVYLSRITAPDGTSVNYTYSRDALQKITYPDGRCTEITANTTGMPFVITSYSPDRSEMQGVVYKYENDKICLITEGGTSNGGEISNRQSYYVPSVASSKTVVRTKEYTDNDDGTTTGNDVVTVYSFDEDGEIVSEYVYSSEISKTGGSVGENGISTENFTNNLLSNVAFQGSSNWEMTLLGQITFTCDRTTDSENALYRGNVLRMVSGDESHANAGLYQSVAVEAGQYTFSAYLRIVTYITGDSNPGAYLRIVDADGNILGESVRISSVSSAYKRLTAHFELASAQEITVQILMDGAGTVYGCAPQLEANPCASAYNLLQNGDFHSQEQGWSCSDGVQIASANYFNATGGLRIAGNVGAERCASQSVPVFAEAGTRETFTLSGWAKADGLPVRDRGTSSAPAFRLKAVIQYNDSENTKEEYFADFTSRTSDWQYASIQFAKKQYLQVRNISINCDYGYNTGTAYFDNIQLVRDSLETGLTADDFIEAQSEEEEESATVFEEAKDTYGNTVTETVFDPDHLNCGTIYRSFTYGNNGNDLTQETDPRGNVTSYDVDANTSRINTVTDRCGNKTGYVYDDCGRTTAVTSKDAADAELANVAYTYDSLDNLAGIVRGDGMGYALQYDAFHELESIGVTGKDEKLVTYGYNSHHGRLKTVTYANGDTMKVAYNALGQLVSEKWYDSANTLTASYRYVYDNQGTVIRSIDILNLKEYNYSYEEGRLLRAVECTITLDDYENVTSRTTVNEIRYNYDADGNMIEKQITPAVGPRYYVHTESTDNVETVQYGGLTTGLITCQTHTDALGRKVRDAVAFGNVGVSRFFYYHNGQVTPTHTQNDKVQSDPTTRLVSRIDITGLSSLQYFYDAEERITKVIGPLAETTEYTYDALGQLLTETVNGTVVNTMTYDNYGNILTKNGKVYTYGNSAWKDMLTAYDGKAIVYDAQGNPTAYMGKRLVWEKGRQLKVFGAYRYGYNANGIRTRKLVNGVTHNYVLDGSKILQETFGSTVLTPIYDSEDSVCGLVYNATPFFFIKNLQGDVIGIVNRTGAIVARYSYDAWGACTILSDISGINIATRNPFRYRGYYFDTETNLYYLQSRYYDPLTGRFINADLLDQPYYDKCAPNFLSSYAYCAGNPVNNLDYSGNWILPKLVASGIQVEVNASFISLGFEIIFANGCAYLFTYGGFSYSKTFDELLNWIKISMINSFSVSNIKRSLKKIFSGSASICVFAVFNSVSSVFNPKSYTGPFAGFSTTVPTIYGAAFKAYFSTWDVLTSVGVGFSWPTSFDYGGAYTIYTYRKKIDMAAKIKNFVSKQTKGLKP